MNWKCPYCPEDGFDEATLSTHIREQHPISDEEHEALDAAEVAGPLEGNKEDGQVIEALVRKAFEEEMKEREEPIEEPAREPTPIGYVIAFVVLVIILTFVLRSVL